MAAVGSGGDRDATAPGLQINEGESVTVTLTANGLTAGRVLANINYGGGSATFGQNEDYVGPNLGSAQTTFDVTHPATTQMFTITTRDDSDFEGAETFVLSYGGSAIGIGATPASWSFGTPLTITVTILGNDGNEFSIAAGAATVAEDVGNITFTVTMIGEALSSGNRTVNWAASGAGIDSGDLDMTSGTLTFTNTGDQTLTLAVTDDSDSEGDETLTVTLSNPSGGATISGTAASASTVIEDNDAVRTLTVTGPAGGSITEGSAGTFTVNLARTAFTSPTVVTWTIIHGDTVDADFAAVTGRVNFGIGDASQTFTITAAADNIDEADDSEDFTVQLSVADDSADGGTAVEEASARVTFMVADNDMAGLVLAPATLEVPEGGEAEYTVRLRTQPTAATVTVTVSGGGTTVTVSPAALTFTAANWSTPQTVTVTADAEGDATLTHAVTGTDEYANADNSLNEDLEVTVTAAVRTLTVTGPGSITEGAAGTFNIGIVGTAFSSPTAVTWSISHAQTSGTSDADFGGAGGLTGSVTFPTQTSFTITPADDDFVESAEAFTVQIAVADEGTDGGTAFGAAASVSITDNDEAGLVIAPTALSIPAGGEAEYTVRLRTQPVDNTATVTVTISGGGTAVAVAPAALSFNAAGWNTSQTVTVTAADAEGDATLTHAVTGTDEYANADNSLNENLRVTVTAATVRTLTVTGPASIEEGTGGAYTVTLTGTAFSAPAAVTWTVTHGDTVEADFAAVTGSVNFGIGDTRQTFTITPADDDLNEDAESFTVQIAVADEGADGGTAFGAAASVSITDNDEAGLVIAPTALSIPAGGEAEYTVRLMTQPVDNTAIVTVTISGGGTAVAVAVAPAALTFTAAGWNTPQTVTVTADAGVDESAVLTHLVSGTGEYANADRSLNRRLTVTIAAPPPTMQSPHELLLPEVTRAVAGEVFGAIAGRAGAIDGGPAASGLAPKWSLAAAHLQALSDGDGAGHIDSKEWLRGLEFALPLAASHDDPGGHGIALWGGSDYRDFSGEHGDSDWGGSVLSLRFGVDGPVRRNLRAGLMVSYSDSQNEYTQVDAGDTGRQGDYELDLTAVSPYLSWRLPNGGSAWASVSYGSGEAEVKPDDGEASTHDVNLTGIAAGGGRRLFNDSARELSLKADAFIAEAEVEGNEAMETDASRLRVALAWRYRQWFSDRRLTPAIDLGLRHDGGDGRTGTGVEVGGALRFHAPDANLTLEGNARALIGHSGGSRGWGVGGLMRVQAGADGQGLAVSVAPSYGSDWHGAAGDLRLWGGGLTAAAKSVADPAARLDAEVGYGLPAVGIGMLTPYTALRVSDTKRDYRLGLRWRAARLDLDVFARRAAADNALAVEGQLRF